MSRGRDICRGLYGRWGGLRLGHAHAGELQPSRQARDLRVGALARYATATVTIIVILTRLLTPIRNKASVSEHEGDNDYSNNIDREVTTRIHAGVLAPDD